MRGAIAVFAKTIPLSAVKTRLAAETSTAFAEQFYHHSVKAVTEVVQTACLRSDNSLTPYWSLAEQQAVTYPEWQNFTPLWTGEGGLGERQAHIYATLLQTFDFVLLIGTDSPQLRPEAIQEAESILSKAPLSCVIGPANDGGYYLFGSGKEIALPVWLGIPYSQSNTKDMLQASLAEDSLPIHNLDEEEDVDTLADLHCVHQKLLRRDTLLPAQKTLSDWLTHNLLLKT